MARIVWAEPAIHDLREIAEYIELDSPKAAKALIQEVFTAIDSLERFPNSGRKPPEIKGSMYRAKIIGPCRVFYRQSHGDILIVYVMRAEKMLRKYMLNHRANHL